MLYWSFFLVDIFVFFKDSLNSLKVGLWQCAKKIYVISSNSICGKSGSLSQNLTWKHSFSRGFQISIMIGLSHKKVGKIRFMAKVENFYAVKSLSAFIQKLLRSELIKEHLFFKKKNCIYICCQNAA